MESDSEHPSKKKRSRGALSCAPCRKRKIKCDRAEPICSACRRRNVEQLCDVSQMNALAAMREGSDIAPGYASGAGPDRVPIARPDGKGRPRVMPIRRGPFVPGDKPFSFPLAQPTAPPPPVALSAYLDNGTDEFIGNVASLRKEPTVHKCTCTDDVPCLVHSEASKRFFNLLTNWKINSSNEVIRKASNSLAAATAAHKKRLESPLTWSYKSSIIVPEVTNEFSRRALIQVYESLPSFSLVEKCISLYFEHFNWLWTIMHPDIFWVTFKAYKEILFEKRVGIMSIDPAFTAIVLTIVATVCQATASPEALLGHPVEITVWDEFVMPIYDAARKALEASRWLETPSIRTIQAAILLSDFICLYYGEDTGIGLSYIILAYRHCFLLNYHVEDFRLGVNVPLDPSLPPDNLILNREVRRRVLLSVSLRFAPESVSGPFRAPGSRLSPIPLPINCQMADLLKPAVAQAKSFSFVERPPYQRPMHEITDAWLDLSLRYLLDAFQSVHEASEGLSANERVENEEKCFVKLFVITHGLADVSLLDPVTCEIRMDRALDRIMHYDPNSAHPTGHDFIRCFSVQLAAHSIFNIHRGFFELHLRTGKHPKSSVKAIEAARQILRLELMLRASPGLRMGVHICSVQRAIIVIFMAFLMSSNPRSAILAPNEDSAKSHSNIPPTVSTALGAKTPVQNESLLLSSIFSINDLENDDIPTFGRPLPPEDQQGDLPRATPTLEPEAYNELNEILKPEYLKKDLDIVNRLIPEFEPMAQNQGVIANQRAAQSGIALNILKYLSSCLTAKLFGVMDTTQQNAPAATASEGIPPPADPLRNKAPEGDVNFTLDELLALSDDFAGQLTQSLTDDNIFNYPRSGFEPSWKFLGL